MTNRYAASQILPNGYEPSWAEISGHLGGIYPFQDKSAPSSCSLDIGDIIAGRRARGEPIALDSAALATKLHSPNMDKSTQIPNSLHLNSKMSYCDKPRLKFEAQIQFGFS